MSHNYSNKPEVEARAVKFEDYYYRLHSYATQVLRKTTGRKYVVSHIGFGEQTRLGRLRDGGNYYADGTKAGRFQGSYHKALREVIIGHTDEDAYAALARVVLDKKHGFDSIGGTLTAGETYYLSHHRYKGVCFLLPVTVKLRGIDYEYEHNTNNISQA